MIYLFAGDRNNAWAGFLRARFVRSLSEGTSSARSTFQQVIARVSDAELFSRLIVITNAEFRFVVAEQLRDRGIAADIVLEPMRRDSGPAVAVSAVLASERDASAFVLVLAADHVIGKLDEFRSACRIAAQTAAKAPIYVN
jgi:mannose-1-phosphate guanylyltransferase/mannose-6-phosphate isomerase